MSSTGGALNPLNLSYPWSILAKYPGDFNGDGISDIAILKKNNNSGDQNLEIFIHDKNGIATKTETIMVTAYVPDDFVWGGSLSSNKGIKQSDFDGNGVDDIVMYSADPNNVQVEIFLMDHDGKVLDLFHN